MRDSSYLWESIHALGYSREDASVGELVLDVVQNYEFLWDHGHLDKYILRYIYAITKVEIFDFNAHVLGLDVIYDSVYMQLHCG